MHINWTSSEIYGPTHLREKLCPIKSETQHQPRNKLSGGHEKISSMDMLDKKYMFEIALITKIYRKKVFLLICVYVSINRFQYTTYKT